VSAALRAAVSPEESDAHASAINGHRRVIDALARVAPIAQRPSSNASSPLAF